MAHRATLSNGESFTIDDNELVLDAALRHGIALPHGCRGGACGACKCKISGEVSYDDEPMAICDDEKADGYVLPCVAKAHSDLTIEAEIESPPATEEWRRYQVTITPSGTKFFVESGETVLDAAIRLGISLPYGCRGGNCGACEARLASGNIKYQSKPWALDSDKESSDRILTCVAEPDGDITIEVLLVGEGKPLPIHAYPGKIIAMDRLTDDVMRLGLRIPEDVRMPYRAGQYAEFLLQDGERRAFSIANSPHDDTVLDFHIRHVPDGKFTDDLFGKMQIGDIIRFEGPMGTFYIRDSSTRPMIMLCTGTGFGPVKAIIEHLIAEKSKRQIYLYWGAYNEQAIYMNELAQHWDKEYENIHFRPVLTHPDAEWQGRTGFVQEKVVEDIANLADFEVYACGNPNMVYASRDLLVANGLRANLCYSDAFELAAPLEAAKKG